MDAHESESEQAGSTPQRRRRRIIIAVVVVAAVVVAACYGAMIWAFVLMASTPEEQNLSLARVSQLTGVVFPEGTQLQGAQHLWSNMTGGSSLRARLTLERGDVPKLIAALPGTVTRRPANTSHALDNAKGLPTWWDPDSVRKFDIVMARRAATGKEEMGKEVLLLISKDDPKIVVVYLYFVAR